MPTLSRPRAAIAFILVTVLLDMLAMSIVIPVLPRLVLSFEGNDAASAARVLGVFGTAFNLMQFLFAPLIGALSDRVGRRPVILLSNFGLGLDYVLMALAPGISLLFLGRLISRLTAATMSTASAYIADTTPPERRAGAFGLISVAFGIGFVLGPALGGLLGGLDPRLPFWVAAGLSLGNGCYGLVVLPESLPRDRRAPLSWRRANPLASFALLARLPQLRGIGAVQFLFFLAQHSLLSVFVIASAYRYHWPAAMNGLALAAYGTCAAVVGGVLVRRVVRRLGERRTVFVGLACAAIGYLGFAAADQPGLAWAALPVLSLMGLVGPAAQGLSTRLVASNEQGRLQGANSTVMSLAGLAGPSLFSSVFALALPALPGAPFYLAAAITLGALMVALGALRRIATKPAAVATGSA